MKRTATRALAALLAVFFVFAGALPKAFAIDAPPECFSETYIVFDRETGQAILGKDMHKKMYPASITKVLTVALVMERHQMNEQITVTESMIAGIDPESSHIALAEGEQVTVEEMVYATMLYSANDAANVLAEYDAGTLDAFVWKMNNKAKELGAVNTNFMNANGLHDDDHYTTAYDFALILQWALTVKGFEEVFGAAEYDMEATNLNEARHFGTDDCLTVTSEYTYNGAVGGKLGWTPQATHTFVSAAKREDMSLIFVSLATPTQWDKFKDAVALYDYVFDNYKKASVSTASAEIPTSVPVGEVENPTENITFRVPSELRVDIPSDDEGTNLTVKHNLPQFYLDKKDLAPQLSVYNGEDLLYSVPLEYQVAAAAAPVVANPPEESGESPLWPILKGLLTVVVVLALLCVVFFLALCVLRYRNLSRRRKNQGRR